MSEVTPPRWAEIALRVLLRRRDRETVSGDLLEEYREVIVPTRRAARARLWYLGEIVSLIDGARLGVALGLAVGLWILIDTAVQPLAEDAPALVGAMFGGMLLFLAIPGFAVRRRGGSLLDTAQAGAVAGAIALALFHAFGVVRVNVFLDSIRHRSDWEGLVADFQRSGFHSLRSYANYVYGRAVVLLPLLGAVAGAASSTIGGLLAGAAWGQGSPRQPAGS